MDDVMLLCASASNSMSRLKLAFALAMCCALFLEINAKASNILIRYTRKYTISQWPFLLSCMSLVRKLTRNSVMLRALFLELNVYFEHMCSSLKVRRC
jgi:hypothetical protein